MEAFSFQVVEDDFRLLPLQKTLYVIFDLSIKGLLLYLCVGPKFTNTNKVFASILRNLPPAEQGLALLHLHIDPGCNLIKHTQCTCFHTSSQHSTEGVESGLFPQLSFLSPANQHESVLFCGLRLGAAVLICLQLDIKYFFNPGLRKSLKIKVSFSKSTEIHLSLFLHLSCRNSRRSLRDVCQGIRVMAKLSLCWVRWPELRATGRKLLSFMRKL